MQKLVQGSINFANKVPVILKNSATWSAPRLRIAWQYTRAELAPPMPKEFPAVASGFANLLRAAGEARFAKATVRQAVLHTAVATEVLCWFFVGEIIGKKSLIGYGNVAGAFQTHV